jgi:hypothetical protein
MNNPLIYTDPDGENPLIAAIFISAFMNTMMQGMSGNINNTGDFFKAMGIGAIAGAAGYGVGNFVNGALGTATTLGGSILNGSVTGIAGGFTGGFINGSGNGWANGENFGKGLLSGMQNGGYGALGGAIIGGITGGLQYRKQMLFFRKGNGMLGIDGDDVVTATDKFLSEAQKAWYPDAPMDKVDLFTVEHVPKKYTDIFENTNSNALTVPKALKGSLTGRSNVYFNQNIFKSSKELFFSMGHEFVHVSQFASLVGAKSDLLSKPLFHEMIEFHAYSYQHTLTANGVKGTIMNSFSQSTIKEMMSQYAEYFSKLNYINFPWTSNVKYAFPF